MPKSILPVVLSIFFVMSVFLSSCSSTTPLMPYDESISDSDSLPVFISDRSADGSALEGMGLLGAYTIELDTESMSAELTPIRQASITDSLETIDITNFLSYLPCRNCINIRQIGINENNQIVMNIGIKHPFDIGNPLEPITGKNRIDLHVFNVEGIMAIVRGPIGTKTFEGDRVVAIYGLANPSGYTEYLNPYLDSILFTSATIHPYILHFDNYDDGNYLPGFFTSGFSDVYNPTGNLVMKQGSGYSYKDYILNVEPGQSYQFMFAVGCTYGVSTNDYEERFTPVYRIPQFNKKAASEVSVEVSENVMLQGNLNGTAKVSVRVLDMNHGVAVGTRIDEMSHDSSINRITIYVPDIMADPMVDDTPVEISGDPRNPANPLLFEYTISNELDPPEGLYLGLVEVQDSFPSGTNTHPFINGKDGASRVPVGGDSLGGLFDIDRFVTYQIFEYEILPSVLFETIPVMPNPRAYARAAVVGDIIYVIGGMNGVSVSDTRSDKIDAFDTVANTWDTSLTPMPTARAGMAVASVGDKIYVIGGLLEAGSGATNVMEVYDTTLDTWETAATVLPGPNRHGMGCVVKENVIYVFGGFNIAQTELNIAHRFDTVLESWGALNPMVAERTQFAMTIKNDTIYVAGGDPVLSTDASKVEEFDTVSATWSYPASNSSIADIAPDPYIGILAPCWENVNGQIVFAGGAYDTDLLEEKVYIYIETTGEFLHVGEVVLPRLLFASASHEDSIYLFGGIALNDSDPPAPYLTPTAEKGTL